MADKCDYDPKSKKQKEHKEQNFKIKVDKRVEEMEKGMHSEDSKVFDEAWKIHAKKHYANLPHIVTAPEKPKPKKDKPKKKKK